MTTTTERTERTERRTSRRAAFGILAGATVRDRALACLGAVAGIGLVALASAAVRGAALGDPSIFAPLGASAVLLFAVPASPMAQPWPIVGGNALSAASGLIVAAIVPDRTIAAGLAVGLAVGVMSITRSMHPPGGAAALTAALGGPSVSAAGTAFPLVPVGIEALGLVALGWAYHRLRGHTYPRSSSAASAASSGTLDLPPSWRVGPTRQDLDEVLDELGETFDISPADLALLVREVEAHALVREHGDLMAADIMSTDIHSVSRGDDPAAARSILLESGVRLLPVLDEHRHVIGAVGLRELARPGRSITELMAPALTADPRTPAVTLIEPLTDGHLHAAMIVDDSRRLLGIVSQADLLAALARRLQCA